MSEELHVLSLGAGVQSTCVYLMGHEGILPLTHAIFADPGEETRETMAHLQWLDNLHTIPIFIMSRGRIGDDLLQGLNATGQRFVSIPVFMQNAEGKMAMLRRQCTKEYKIDVVDRCLRREILGLKPRARIPKDIHVHFYFGISADEARRTNGIRKRYADKKWASIHFPLVDLWMTRADCHKWMHGKVPHVVPRSSCVFCPYHDDNEWKRLKEDAHAWTRIVQIDRGLRSGSIHQRKINSPMFLHRSLQPIEEVDFMEEKQVNYPLFSGECEGMCGV